MLVDDSPTILMSLSAILIKHRFVVMTATNGKDALAQVSDTSPDLIICDVRMPQMNGIAFLKEARLIHKLRFTPILMLTAADDPVERQAARKAGATGWLVKKISSDALLSVIHHIIAQGQGDDSAALGRPGPEPAWALAAAR